MKKWKFSCLTAAIIALVLQPAVLMTGADNQATSGSSTPVSPPAFVSEDAQSYVPICRNERYTLGYREDIHALSVTDVSGQNRWNSVVTQEVYDLTSASSTWSSYMQSIMAINYASHKETHGNVIKSYSSGENTVITAYRLENGLRMVVDFQEASIRIAVDVFLESDGLRTQILTSEIEEYGEYALYSIELFPFFDAAPRQADGYLFYPEGNGALSYFNKSGNKSLFASELILDIYGPMNQEELLSDAHNGYAMLPVYGMKQNERGFLAAITKGDSSASIVVNTSLELSPVPLNRAFFEFVYRNSSRIYLSNLTPNGQAAADNIYGTKADKNRLEQDCEVKIFFLTGEQACYDGMANIYRKYLKDNGLLVKNAQADTMSMGLTLFMSAPKKGGLSSDAVATSFEQAATILRDYRKAGLSNMRVLLRGWEKGGYQSRPQKYRPSSALGGKNKLKQLIADGENTDFFSMEIDILGTKKRFLDFIKSRKYILMGNGSAVTNKEQNEFLISPDSSRKKLEDATAYLKKQVGGTVAVSHIGKTLYRDYSRTAYTREDTLQLFRSMAKGVDVEGGNLYVLNGARSLYDIPEQSAMHQITDEAIPWFQLVVHGSIPYTMQAGNYASDLTEQTLRWAEYGCMPYFELTAENPIVLKDTSYNMLFSSQNATWFDRVVQITKAFEENLGVVRGQEIIGHKKIDTDLVIVEYGNGYQVIVNYKKEIQKYQDISSDPQSYLVTRKEESEHEASPN